MEIGRKYGAFGVAMRNIKTSTLKVRNNEMAKLTPQETRVSQRGTKPLSGFWLLSIWRFSLIFDFTAVGLKVMVVDFAVPDFLLLHTVRRLT
jgi:hypothetical protein